MKTRIGVAITAVALSGCSTGVVKLEENVFMVSVTSATIGFRAADEERAKCYIQANKYCAEFGKEVKTVNVEARGSGFARPAKARLEFSCVDKAQ